MLEVEGTRQLRKTLKAAGQDLGELKAANRTAAEIAAKAAGGLVPSRSGRLEATVRASGTNAAGIVRAGTKRAPYANAVHWGRVFWPNRRHTRRARSKTDAQPFLTEGAQKSEGQWLPVYQRNINQILSQVKGK